ncbi:SH3 domain-containing protein 19 [Chanos chanos]|uniref:SH3 domain-containing protein 19 n=1 Tax=Chanos chanos TaxID=29144 RepID=A0A6J2WF58_CHACN|nr:SH3 domain-containing protein 19 [Chanos chanos]
MGWALSSVSPVNSFWFKFYPHLFSSQGPLSSLRAAFKRTSARAHSHIDCTRDRRRPEITILSAEPLPSNSWLTGFTGTPGTFLPPPDSSQFQWGGRNATTAEPPPSYEQVIKEKTQEQVTSPTPPPRRSHTTTIATQTESVEEDPTGQESSDTSQRSVPGAKKPQKPPRLSLSSRSKAAPRAALAKPAEDVLTTPTEDHTDSYGQRTSANTSLDRSCSDQSTSTSVLSESPSPFLDTTPALPDPTFAPPTDPVPIARPVPRPRSKSKPALTPEVKVQTLVRLQDSGNGAPVINPNNSPVSTGKYLKELLDVFNTDIQVDQATPDKDQEDQSDPSEEDSDTMSALHSDRNIRARIQAFESQTGEYQSDAPAPRPRNSLTKPPVLAPKPTVAPRPSIKKPPVVPVEEDNYYEEVNPFPEQDEPDPTSPCSSVPNNDPDPNPFSAFTADPFQAPAANPFTTPVVNSLPKAAPPPLPKPSPPQLPKPAPSQLPRKPSVMSREPSTSQPPVKVPLIPPSRPSLVRTKNVSEEDPVIKGPPTPLKPSKDLLNYNNHNSTSLPSTSPSTRVENEYTDTPNIPTPTLPPRGAGPSLSRQSVARRPTVIRVPSKSEKQNPDFPPPLPVQNPVGGPTPPTKPAQRGSLKRDPLKSSVSTPDLCLPPRPSGGKAPPPRPPPAKTAPGRPPPPRKAGSQRAPSTNGSPSHTPPKPQQGGRAAKKGPVLPPRPNPGHRLYNKYTLEIPHGIAVCDHNGRNSGELSFQKNEVLVLLEKIDSKTFECQVGDAKGTVQKSLMKIITPLSDFSDHHEPQGVGSVQSGGQGGVLQVQALFDFVPEGPGELALKAGDVVSKVEKLDSEWYLGTCNGITGFFPINYVKTLSGSASNPSPERRAKAQPAAVSGPRCVARFDFDAEHSDELTFCEGDLIKLVEYVGLDWARGELDTRVGIFPLNFVEIVEDLPPPPAQQTAPAKIALPGMAASPKVPSEPKPQVGQAQSDGAEWAVALYDFTAETSEDLAFKQGDYILVTAHVDDEWCRGRLNGREGFFPKAFVETSPGGVLSY